MFTDYASPFMPFLLVTFDDYVHHLSSAERHTFSDWRSIFMDTYGGGLAWSTFCWRWLCTSIPSCLHFLGRMDFRAWIHVRKEQGSLLFAKYEI